ncbi:tricin synthase 1-like isoform X4 [Panicum virgatum]|uniref:tricin synthase 1-like isoform X4 n=1 Tax=Panicum virgatum TaxID=38727 RepID=UPI0019D629F9|nr:tricin synthase 1-like isoform X4 [Panicum virgatum]
MSPRLAAAPPLLAPPAAAAARELAVPRPRTLLPGASVAFSSPSSRRGALACLVRLMGSRHSSAAAAAAEAVEEARRGRKQLGMTPPLYDYLLANVREHPVLRELREETAAMRGSQMQVSPAQAQLLAMLVQIQGAQRCIEVGVFTGYSSLAVALALPESGHLVACERDKRCLEVAKKYYQRAGVAHKIDVKHALAADSLRSLLDCGEASSYDFAFVDADKRMYEEYFELLLKLVPIGDGMTICRKLVDT